MRDIFELAPHILPFAPGCPEPVMVQYAREAAIKFCQRSRSWRSDEIYPLVGPEINVMAQCDAVIFDIESVRWRQSVGDQWSRRLDPVQYDEIADEYRDGNPQYFAQKIAGTLQVSPFAAGELRVVMYLKPDSNTFELPDYLIELHTETIAAGALSKILTLSKYDFYEPNLAMMHLNTFNTALDANFRENTRGQQRARSRSKASFL